MFLRTVFALNLYSSRELMAGFQLKTIGNLSIPYQKMQAIRKTAVFKSLHLAFHGSDTNSRAIGPITKARVKRK